jgi:hypothetical protein
MRNATAASNYAIEIRIDCRQGLNATRTLELVAIAVERLFKIYFTSVTLKSENTQVELFSSEVDSP